MHGEVFMMELGAPHYNNDIIVSDAQLMYHVYTICFIGDIFGLVFVV